MRAALTSILLAIFPTQAYAQEIWQAELDNPIRIGPPVCPGYPAAKNGSAYKLCVPSSIARNLELGSNKNSLILKEAGAINGPLLVKTTPPAILIGAMQLKSGAMIMNIKPAGGLEMREIRGSLEIEGLVIPLPADRSLEVDKVTLEFTSPEDARLQISASGQEANVTLRVNSPTANRYHFVPSPPANSIFPDNPFFSEFDGEITEDRLELRFQKKIRIALEKTEEEDPQ